MDVEPLVPFRGHRRQMRRPVAGGLPYAPQLEAMLDDPPEPTPPSLLLCGGLVLVGLVGAAGLGCLVAQLVWNRLYRDVMGG